MSTDQITPQEVCQFWLEEVGPEGWYIQDDTLDAKIRDRYAASWELAAKGRLEGWRYSATGTLGYLILTDQFPRNMFRGDGRSFATDLRAVRGAKRAITKDWDLQIAPPERQFFYLPLMHSEIQTDQDWSVRLFKARMPEGNDNLRHARAHRAVIREFSRFPYRNEALGRETRADEQAFLESGGYGAALNALP